MERPWIIRWLMQRTRACEMSGKSIFAGRPVIRRMLVSFQKVTISSGSGNDNGD